MKAAVLYEPKQALRIDEIQTPAPTSNQVLIKVEACGVCHSDLHLAEGDWPQLKKMMKLPLVLGHEVVGRVVKTGDSVGNLKEGDRVGVPWIHWSCGECEYCSDGLENLCAAQLVTGGSVDGGYAEYLTAPASHALKVPDNLRPEEAAPLFCAGVTVYRAIKKSRVRPGQRLAVIGVGGLGHLAIQVARTFDANVIAVDVSNDKLELATSLGANATINAAETNAAKELRAMGSAHIAVVTASTKAAYDTAFASLTRAGTLVAVGMPSEMLSFSAIVLGETKIMASAVGTRQDLAEVLQMASSGKLRCRVETKPLEEINQIFDRLRRSQITGRVVVTP